MRTPAELTALVVDDNDYARALAETSLKKLGIGTVLEAADAATGLELLSRTPVDVIVLDWYMPEINGAGFVRMARAQDLTAAIVVATAYATKQTFARMGELGLQHYLVKPFTTQQLHKKIMDALTDGWGELATEAVRL